MSSLVRFKRKPVLLKSRVEVVRVPDGDMVWLEAGTEVIVERALGGFFALRNTLGALFRLSGAEGAALDREPLFLPPVPAGPIDGAAIIEQLKHCFDPEIPCNIVDLGLIYGCTLRPGPAESQNGAKSFIIDVRMTLTAPGCGMGQVLVDDIKAILMRLPSVVDVLVEIAFDPPWEPSRMSEVGRLTTGLVG